MGLDNYTRIFYGWKVTGKQVDKIQTEIEDICENVYHNDMYNIIDECYIDDTMCGEYFYFGALLGSIDVYDAENGGNDEIIVNDKLINKAISKYNKMIREYPEIDKIFGKYSNNKKPQLYIMQNIW